MDEVTLEVGVGELFAGYAGAFLHRQVARDSVQRAWLAPDGRAACWSGTGRTAAGPAAVVTVLGTAEAAAPLLAEASSAVEPPERLTVEAAALGAVPAAWRHAERWSWDWMSVSEEAFTPSAPDRTAPGPPPVVEDLDQGAGEAVLALLEEGFPDSVARPGTPGVLTWHAVRDPADPSRLLAAGALVGQPDGSALLRGVTTHPAARGRGLAALVSASLTRTALERAPLAALGVYAHNAPALRVYRRLGYARAHAFVSGPLEPTTRSSTTAAEPSR